MKKMIEVLPPPTCMRRYGPRVKSIALKKINAKKTNEEGEGRKEENAEEFETAILPSYLSIEKARVGVTYKNPLLCLSKGMCACVFLCRVCLSG